LFTGKGGLVAELDGGDDLKRNDDDAVSEGLGEVA
jgi:tRNA U34 5-methylaminomethyl-2-thiouridine-forming methyltransferase MnmC